jgi:hypothetical protein
MDHIEVLRRRIEGTEWAHKVDLGRIAFLLTGEEFRPSDFESVCRYAKQLRAALEELANEETWEQAYPGVPRTFLTMELVADGALTCR